MVELRRRNLSKQSGQLNSRLDRGIKKAVVKRQNGHLFGCRINQRFLTIAHIDAPQTRHAIKDFIVIRIPHMHAFSTRDDARTFAGQIFVIGERM